jgi:molybdopterin/thiamine biosynthesis adenylyltransferase
MRNSLFVVGLGNIGSHLVALLHSLPAVVSVGLIDFERYESANLGFQRIDPAAVGRRKAHVQARLLRRMRPDLEVTAYPCRFENVPLGVLRGSVILACLDSRAARQMVNRTAFALATPWIDAALDRAGSVRARAYLPGYGSCLECGWGVQDYALLEQRLPCPLDGGRPAPTAAAPELGAIAAALAVSLCRRLLAEVDARETLADRQWFLDVPSGRGWMGVYAANPECRLDHAGWDIVADGHGSVDMPLREALALGGADPTESSLSVLNHVFVHRVRCPKCRAVRRVRCRLSGRLPECRCAACSLPMLVAAIDSEPRLGWHSAGATVLAEPLARRGFVPGDVVSVGDAGAPRHFQLA